MREFNFTSVQVRPNRQVGTTVMRQMEPIGRMKLPFNKAASGTEQCDGISEEICSK